MEAKNMSEKKRKSISVDNQLWLDAKAEAIRRGDTLEGLIEDLLVRWLETKEHPNDIQGKIECFRDIVL
jgi:hypothetical protein